jgi:hypothetical protein
VGSILIFDASVASLNSGDKIITEAVEKQLRTVFPEHHFFTTSTHEVVSRYSHRLNRDAEFSFVGGTNLLSSRVNDYNQWKINFIDTLFFENVILLGVGWWQYQRAANRYTSLFYRNFLHHTLLHSVRDSYAASQLLAVLGHDVGNTFRVVT